MPSAAPFNDIIYPCPLFKGYGLPVKEAWQLLSVFLGYRLILASGLLVLIYFPLDPAPLEYINPALFKYTSFSYFAITLVAGLGIFTRLIPYSLQAQLLIFTDIAAITLIMHACGGVTSGIGILLIISIAFGGILIGGHCAMVFAAIASLSVLAQHYFSLQQYNLINHNFTASGLLGAAFFTTAFLAFVLAQRSEQSQLIAQQQKQTILKLEELNQSIIQHLQAGIIIVDKEQAIQMSNQATLRLLSFKSTPLTLLDISVVLAVAFQNWLNNQENNLVAIKLADQLQVHCRFSLLPTQQETLYMILLEDSALYNQRLQQSKLASLGRLTASIAHEIRNPLGAISHAAQLLAECLTLSEQDLRLTQIIQAHSQRINGIIEEILHLSRRKTSHRQTLAIKAWLNDYRQNFLLFQHIEASQFALHWHSEEDYKVLIDPDHLKQILDNLCLNAFKHNDAPRAEIRLSTERTALGICLSLIDNGSAINSENLEHLFEPFFTTSASGTGLGLYISKELAELNQAKLSYSPLCFGDKIDPEIKQFNRFKLCLADAEQLKLEL